MNKLPPKTVQPNTQAAPADYWSLALEQLLSAMHASKEGLQPADAEQRLKQYGPNTITAKQQATALRLLLRQFKSPLVLILIFAAIVSGFLGEWVDASIILVIVLGSTILGFVQEYSATNAVEKLRSQVTVKSSVLRGGQPQMLRRQSDPGGRHRAGGK
jgi:Mg2+-importing ATPase